MHRTNSHISTWGNGLALRLTKPMAKAAGVSEGSPVTVSVEPGRIVIEVQVDPTLDQMLAAFDPARHAGESLEAALKRFDAVFGVCSH